MKKLKYYVYEKLDGEYVRTAKFRDNWSALDCANRKRLKGQDVFVSDKKEINKST
tara:strand:+ start:113 stop:277 length:165 start_codon:yes stop_codon:yes gene_type:complete